MMNEIMNENLPHEALLKKVEVLKKLLVMMLVALLGVGVLGYVVLTKGMLAFLLVSMSVSVSIPLAFFSAWKVTSDDLSSALVKLEAWEEKAALWEHEKAKLVKEREDHFKLATYVSKLASAFVPDPKPE